MSISKIEPLAMNMETVFDSAVSGEYVETLAGKTHTFTQRSVRYVRDYLNGSTANSGNHWTEIEVWGTATTAYVGDYFEWNGSPQTMTRYYSAGGTRVAVRNSNGNGTNGLVYLFGDHLGSASVTADPLDGDKLSELRYKAWGESRYTSGTLPTRYTYTGQYSYASDFGLVFYSSRFYDPYLSHFVQPDRIIPNPYHPLDRNRYAYARYNPLVYTDPTGHAACIDDDCALVEHPGSGKPILRNPDKLPPVVSYIYSQLHQNAKAPITWVIAAGNIASHSGSSGPGTFGLLLSWGLWTSQVMDASIKEYAGPISPFVANWDHKPMVRSMDTTSFRSDIWSNIHYGFVGRAAGFTQSELTGGAGIEQIGSNLYQGNEVNYSPGADNWAAGWDDPSDTSAINLGISLWNNYGLGLTRADFYYSVLDNPGLAMRP